MEELLNKLIEKGWKPFWFKWEATRIEIERDKDLDIQIFKLNWIIIEQHHRISWSLRNLVSKESWLWQFVCENKMVKEDCSSIELYIMSEWTWILTDSYYQFWLMRCALKDEEDLEKFLLDNIKVWK